jgi:hypothetical protein
MERDPRLRSTWISGCSMYEQDVKNITFLPFVSSFSREDKR